MDVIEVFKRFPQQEDCIAYLENVRWSDVPKCPYCGSTKSTPLPTERRHHCNNCNTSYSVTVGTIFHQTHLPLQKWLLAVSLILNAKRGTSSRQLARDLDVHRNTAWRMSMRIREAMAQKGHRELLTRIVEMDETYIGPRKPRRKSQDDNRHDRGHTSNKTPVVGMVERGDYGEVRATVVKKDHLKAKHMSGLVREHVDPSQALLMTDQYAGCVTISSSMPHRTVNHQVWYVDGDAHTNTVESFWALLKRGIVGQFHKVSAKYLAQYVDEFCYRYNHRRDADLFTLAIERALGVA